MKTAKAKVVSSTPIRPSKAASILSKFASTKTGASQAVAAYLRRTADAFNELAQLHKELKSTSSRSHRKNHSGYGTDATVGGEENGTRASERNQEPSQPDPIPEELSQDRSRTGEGTERKRRRKKSKEKGEFGNSFSEDVELVEGGKKKHKRKRKERGDDGGFEKNRFQKGKV